MPYFQQFLIVSIIPQNCCEDGISLLLIYIRNRIQNPEIKQKYTYVNGSYCIDRSSNERASCSSCAHFAMIALR
jgi:hypothetical protein